MAIYLNDGTYIYDEKTAVEYLTSLGFDKFDIEDMRRLIAEDTAEDAYRRGYDAAWEDDEAKLDGYYCACRDLAYEIDMLCNEYLGKYKAAAIVKILNNIKTCVRENRIDQ